MGVNLISLLGIGYRHEILDDYQVPLRQRRPYHIECMSCFLRAHFQIQGLTLSSSNSLQPFFTPSSRRLIFGQRFPVFIINTKSFKICFNNILKTILGVCLSIFYRVLIFFKLNFYPIQGPRGTQVTEWICCIDIREGSKSRAVDEVLKILVIKKASSWVSLL